jgi:hypothetical protein
MSWCSKRQSGRYGDVYFSVDLWIQIRNILGYKNWIGAGPEFDPTGHKTAYPGTLFYLTVIKVVVITLKLPQILFVADLPVIFFAWPSFRAGFGFGFGFMFQGSNMDTVRFK